ncbi:MAG: DNA gyrase inhibitor YacG [Pseudomonadota bacterium]
MRASSCTVVEPLRKPVSCPSCGGNSTRESYPFCSRRCQKLDLHKWFSQTYSIASGIQMDQFGET